MKKRRRAKRLQWRRPSRRTLALAAAVAGAALLQVWVQLQVTQLGYEIGLIRGLARRATGERAALSAELAAVTSPRSLDHEARLRLGLRPPAEGQVIGLP